MDDTLTTCGDVHDLKSISDSEGYMSEIAMDYCMMFLSFEVKNVFPDGIDSVIYIKGNLL
jgi:hypothetical protein